MTHPRTDTEFNLPFDICITVTDGYAGLSSGLHEQLVDTSGAVPDEPGLAAVHAMESLLLALAARGLDLGTAQASLAVEDAAGAVAHYLGCL